MANDAAPGVEHGAAHVATQTAPYEVAPGPLPAGPSRVGRYEIREVLGAGAMGVVYRAHDPDLDRSVAIKLVRDSRATSHLRLLREAQAMARLRHPNVVPIFDVGQVDGAVFVAMPLFEGGTLNSWLCDGSHALDAILDRFVAAGRGLAAAHAAGLVHRDFKPDNVLLGSDGGIHVADFGLARRVDADPTPRPNGSPLAAGIVTQPGAVLGTPAYMAPEQLHGLPIDGRADQFSFCVALWEGVYGERPFPDPPPGTEHPLHARLDAIAAGPAPPPRRNRPAWIAPLLVRGLAVDPDRRWPTLQALLDAIAAHRRRRRWPGWLAASLSASSLAAAIVAIGRPEPVPSYHLAPVLPRRGHVTQAAISPGGTRLAFVVDDALVIREIEHGGEERTLIDHGIADEPITWSPDGRHLLAAIVPEVATRIETEMIDAGSGARFKLPVPGRAAFLSSAEVAVTSPRQRSIVILPARPDATAIATCDVPDYTFLLHVAGLPDGTMIVETEKAGDYGLVILRRDCTVRARFSAEPISSFAVSDTGSIVAMVVGDGVGEILELSLDAEVISRRRVTGAPDAILGRRHGIDYVSTLALKTHLDQVHDGKLQRQFSVRGGGSFSVAPDGQTLAWIDLDGRSGGRGRLRITSLQALPQAGGAILDDALLVSWSPDGRRLAALVADGAEVGIVVVEPSSVVRQRLPLQHLAGVTAPVWLNDHRIAGMTDDRTTYRWIDLDTGNQGEITDRAYGSTFWLTRSPRDGMLAMWRNGPPADEHPEHVWIQPAGQAARPLHVPEAMAHFLMPSWTPDGALVVRELDTGVVSRVDLDTGALTPIAQLAPTPMSSMFDDHAAILPGGDLLATDIELGIQVARAVPDDEPIVHTPREPVRNTL